MILSFYDIPVRIDSDGYAYRNGMPTEVYKLNITEDNFDIFDLEEYVEKDLVYNEDFVDAFETDETYYILKDYKEIFGVISLHKGYTFIDCAEHDDRVIIKCGFPHLKCDIIGE